jgi:mRNA-degrading endonuclease toxin of MazEF toxin-antitoxin module
MIPVQRGDVILVDLPFIQDFTQSKQRPALVIQNDTGNHFSANTIVMAISSQPPAKAYPVHYRIVANSPIGKAAGLDKDSVAQAEIILTIPQSLISRKLGALTEPVMREIEKRIKVSLALT